MTMVRLLLLVGLAPCCVSACAPDHDKTFYRSHAEARAAVLAACRRNPGRLAAAPSCVTAEAAEADAFHERFWTTTAPRTRVSDPGHL